MLDYAFASRLQRHSLAALPRKQTETAHGGLPTTTMYIYIYIYIYI